MRETDIRRGENTPEISRVPSNNYLFVPGGDNGIPSGDKWWLFQVNKADESSRNRSGCRVFRVWLDEQATDESHSGKHFLLLSNPVKVYYGSSIKGNKMPVPVPVEERSSGWQNGHVMYTFTSEYCNKHKHY